MGEADADSCLVVLFSVWILVAYSGIDCQDTLPCSMEKKICIDSLTIGWDASVIDSSSAVCLDAGVVLSVLFFR